LQGHGVIEIFTDPCYYDCTYIYMFKLILIILLLTIITNALLIP